jgi:hypothetical protein
MRKTIDFEIQIPQNAMRSYKCEYSEYYWLLETKVNVSGGRDIYAKEYYI